MLSLEARWDIGPNSGFRADAAEKEILSGNTQRVEAIIDCDSSINEIEEQNAAYHIIRVN